MEKLVQTIVSIAVFLIVPQAVAQEDGALPKGPGANLVFAKCQQCHPINYVTDSAGLPDFLWKDTLDLMKQLGMQVTDEEEEKLYRYLTTYLGTDPPPATATITANESAQIDGADIYANSCAVCHGPDRQGISPSFPPLDKHILELAGLDHAYLPLVVLYGLSGKIEVSGNTYNGVMPAWNQLSNREIAAVLNTLIDGVEQQETRTGDVESYTVGEIQAVRGLGLSASDVRERRPELP